jgi:hypothetical protein
MNVYTFREYDNALTVTAKGDGLKDRLRDLSFTWDFDKLFKDAGVLTQLKGHGSGNHGTYTFGENMQWIEFQRKTTTPPVGEVEQSTVHFRYRRGYKHTDFNEEGWLPTPREGVKSEDGGGGWFPVSGIDKVATEGPLEYAQYNPNILGELKGKRGDSIINQFKAGEASGMLGKCGFNDPKVIEEWENWQRDLPENVDGKIEALRSAGECVPTFWLPDFTKKSGQLAEGDVVEGVGLSGIVGGFGGGMAMFQACLLQSLKQRFQVEPVTVSLEGKKILDKQKRDNGEELAKLAEMAKLQHDVLHDLWETNLEPGELVVIAYIAQSGTANRRKLDERLPFCVVEIVDGTSRIAVKKEGRDSSSSGGGEVQIHWYIMDSPQDLWAKSLEDLKSAVTDGKFVKYLGEEQQTAWVPRESILLRNAKLTQKGGLSGLRVKGKRRTVSTKAEMLELIELGLIGTTTNQPAVVVVTTTTTSTALIL